MSAARSFDETYSRAGVMIAALYVQENGCYSGVPDVDTWAEKRDARKYDGPFPVVAHPPCARWGNYAKGSPATWGQYKVGDDGGCFDAAIKAVRNFGGVLEHPRNSKAWAAFGLNSPPVTGGWIVAGDSLGMTCCVYQGHYGHPAQKPTWLYAVGIDAPSLMWGPSAAVQHPTSPRRGVLETLSKRQRAATPAAFRDLLISMARTAATPRDAPFVDIEVDNMKISPPDNFEDLETAREIRDLVGAGE